MMVHPPQVTAVIVTYQSRETVGAALDALQEAYAASFANAVVVDNASTDGTGDFVAERYPWVTLVRSNENLGYGRGCNLGFQHVGTPYVLVMNPDAVVGFAALRTLVTFMEERDRVGMCGPAVKEQSGALQPSGALPAPWKVIVKPLLPGWACRRQRHVIPGEPPVRTDWLCGSILLLRTRVIEQLGGFDPRFFLYFEESDLCRRTQQAGWEIWTVGVAVCEHVNAASAKRTNEPMIWGTLSEHYFKSRFYYMFKHHGPAWAIAAETGELLSMLGRTGLEIVRGRKYPHLGPRLRAPIFRFPSRTTKASACR